MEPRVLELFENPDWYQLKVSSYNNNRMFNHFDNGAKKEGVKFAMFLRDHSSMAFVDGLKIGLEMKYKDLNNEVYLNEKED